MEIFIFQFGILNEGHSSTEQMIVLECCWYTQDFH